MPVGDVIGRGPELGLVFAFLDRSVEGPAGFVIEGEPGIGKSTLWTPLGTTPNFPEYPSAHACHSTAVVKALDVFFGTDKVHFTLDSRVTHTTREYKRLHNIVKEVDGARVFSSASTSATRTCKVRGSGQGRPLRRPSLLPAGPLRRFT